MCDNDIKMKKDIILLTGGGTAGHVTPNLALIPDLIQAGFEIHYIGSKDGIERSLINTCPDVTYHAISSGKLRRYFSLKNMTDPFRVLKGMFESKRILKRLRPRLIFSKGGFVSVPVVISAKRIAPVISHESDYTPGLANRIGTKYAKKICVTFEDTKAFVGQKAVYTGTPIRRELFSGDRSAGLSYLGFDGIKPILLMMGGSLGASAVNDALRLALPKLLPHFDVAHICGNGKIDESLSLPGYAQFEYIKDPLPDVFAATDIVISRAGANAVFEFLALKKPALLIPLPAANSRGDQILNAKYFRKRDYADVLLQEDMTPDTLAERVLLLYDERSKYIDAMKKADAARGTDNVLNVIFETIAASEKNT